MSKEVVADLRAGAREFNAAAPALLIAVPFYRNEHLVGRFVRSLLACSEELRTLRARVVLYNDSPDDGSLHAALQAATEAVADAFDISVRTNARNIGWLKTVNLAMREAIQLRADLLLFNSDTVVFPGAITEMVRAAAGDPMIGFVNPRSNNATLTNLPIGARFEALGPDDAFEAYRSISGSLPAVTYVPTAVGFAILVRRFILQEFGTFDEAYGGGYNEENDLVMRASRCGYRAVLANHAFVWHEGGSSLGATSSSKALAEEANRKILEARYPEYPVLIRQWFDGVEHISERLMSALVPDSHGRRRIAFDFSSFGNYHSGTQKAGYQLLASACAWKDAFDIAVICEPGPFKFHELDKLDVRRCDVHDPETFAAIFRVGQPFDWDVARRLALKGAVTGVFMLDTIALDCSHLYSARLHALWRYVLSTSDFIVYNSEFTAQQFRARFPDARPQRELISLHSLDIEDYAVTPADPDSISPQVRNLPEGYVLIVGNQYPHKAVGDAANRIAEAWPDLQVVALGVTRERSSLQGSPPGVRGPYSPADEKLVGPSNLRGFRVGGLTDAEMDALQQKAGVIVMPSHYEGFGLSLPMALAARKPIIVRNLPPLHEIHARLGKNPNVHFFDTTAELVAMLERPPVWRDAPPPRIARDADRAARDIRKMIETSLAEARYASISSRFRAIHTLQSTTPTPIQPPPLTPPDAIGRRVGDETARFVARLLHNPLAYRMLRGVFRVVMFVRGKR